MDSIYIACNHNNNLLEPKRDFLLHATDSSVPTTKNYLNIPHYFYHFNDTLVTISLKT